RPAESPSVAVSGQSVPGLMALLRWVGPRRPASPLPLVECRRPWLARSAGGIVQDVARIVLGLDSPKLAEEVVDFLDRTGRARVVATAASAGELAAAVRDHRPHAVVGSPALVRSAGGVNGGQFLALDTSESLVALRTAMAAGAAGFYVWPSDRSELAEAAARTVPDSEDGLGGRALVLAVHG